MKKKTKTTLQVVALLSTLAGSLVYMLTQGLEKFGFSNGFLTVVVLCLLVYLFLEKLL